MKNPLIALTFAAALAATAGPGSAEDFRPEAPAVRIAVHENDWQKVIETLKKYGRDIGSPELPIFGIISLRGPEKGEHLADYLEYLGNDQFDFISENWTTQLDPGFARRVIQSKPGLFWKLFPAWPKDASAEPRVANFLGNNPDLRTVAAERTTPSAAQASRLLAFLDANVDLRKAYAHFDIYVDQWIQHHTGADLIGCTHYLLIEDRKSLKDIQEVDPDVGCGPAAQAKHAELLNYWGNYQPPAGPAAPSKPDPRRSTPAGNKPLFQQIQYRVSCSDGTSCRNATIQRICCDKYGECC